MYRPHENFVKTVEVSPLEEANRRLLALADGLRTRRTPGFHMSHVWHGNMMDPCRTPSCALGWAEHWGLMPTGNEHEDFMLDHHDSRLLFGCEHISRTAKDEANIIEGYVKQRRARMLTGNLSLAERGMRDGITD